MMAAASTAGATASTMEQPSEQRRVRHLVGVAARNVSSTDDLDGQPMDLFFTLHATPSAVEFYKSSTVRSLNPTWHVFDPAVDFLSHAPLSSSRLTIRIWAQPQPQSQSQQDPVVLIHWDISLFSLEYLGKQVPADNMFVKAHLSDAIVFQMWDGFFYLPVPPTAAAPTASSLRDEPVTSIAAPLPRIDSTRIKKTYSYATLRRVLEQHRNLQELNENMNKARKKLLAVFEANGSDPAMQRAVEQSRLRRQLLRVELAEQTELLQATKQQLADTQNSLVERSKWVDDALLNLQNSVESVIKANSELSKRIARLRYVLSLVQTRQAALVHSLSSVFPIVQHGSSIGSICGIEIPENPTQQDEERVAAALGYVCHLVTMIAKHIDLSLRYTIRPMCSRSVILETIQDKEQELLLYPRNKDQFDFATRLLNKDVEQIVCYCGVPDVSNQPNSTLKNLKALLHYLSDEKQVPFPNLTKTHSAIGGRTEFNGVACYRYLLTDLQERLPSNLAVRLGQPPVACNFRVENSKIVMGEMHATEHALSKLLTLTDVGRDCCVLVEL
eukprot:m.123363 g.123363  ORF g.123363 m.123363 type:complete len:557 (-) comp16246_c0_seq1:201-1871(-)